MGKRGLGSIDTDGTLVCAYMKGAEEVVGRLTHR